MPRAAAPPWATRKEPVLDHLVRASIDQAGGKHHPDTGHYATLVYKGIETRERADEIKRALHRCALYMHKKGIASVGMSAKVLRDGNGWKVEFRAVDKTMARKYVLQKYGPDRSKWPYSPRRGDANYG
jgi:hypothetical protein